MVAFKLMCHFPYGSHRYLYEVKIIDNSHYRINTNFVHWRQKEPEKGAPTKIFKYTSNFTFGEPFVTVLIGNEQKLVEKNRLKG